jgi:signal transduction histidine kinase
VDLCEVVGEVAAVIEPLAWEKQLDFRLDPCASPQHVHTDGDKVRQILINLAGNAVKFTEQGEVRLSVESRVSDGGNAVPGDVLGEIVIKVSDTGPGISMANRQRLFQPFEQLESGLSRRHGGTGLGLYLSGQFAGLIGGHIEVQSEPGQGSVFSLVLPRVAGTAAEEQGGGGAGEREEVRTEQ